MAPADRYNQLPLSTRALLEDEEQLSELLNAAAFYKRLRPEVREFLYSAQPSTLEWLQHARKEEVDQWASAAKMVSSFGVVGKTLLWILVTLASTITAGAVIANYFGRFK